MSDLPPEIKCRIYRSITDLSDIHALLLANHRNPEELALIYDCIISINTKRQGVSLNINFIIRFRNLRRLSIPIYISRLGDVNKLRELQKLDIVTLMFNDDQVKLEEYIFRSWPYMPNNISEVYFTNSSKSIIYYYHIDTKFLAISIYDRNYINNDNITDIIETITDFQLYHLYLNIHQENYVNQIVTAAIQRNGPTLLISCPFSIVRGFFSIVKRMMLRSEENQYMTLEDILDEEDVYPNIRELHGPFMLSNFIRNQDVFHNVETIGVAIPNNPEVLQQTYDSLNDLDDNIKFIRFYIDPSIFPQVEQKFIRFIRNPSPDQLTISIHPFTELRDLSDEMYIDANLL